MQVTATKVSPFLSWKGLLGTNSPKAIFFQTRWGIHTFFMKYPIDVVILDKTMTIVQLKKNLQPNRIFLWNPVYTNVLELPEGTIEKNKMQQNQKITLQTL